MKVKKVEHIGIAVKNLEHSVSIFEKLLGIKCYSIEKVEDQLVYTAFFLVGDTKIELLESMEPSGPIGLFIDKNGEGIHHIAFSVDNTNEALTNAKNNGFRLIDQIARKGAEEMQIGFLNPKKTNGVLIEFCSKL
jgi:methylmalonyl-CoA/ethylmalonyl-CoA epimerase